MISIIALQVLLGSSIPVSKKLLSYCAPFFLAGLRLFLAGILLIAFNHFYKKRTIILDIHHMWLYFQLLFFGVYVKYMLRYWSLQYLTATKMSFIFNITPFIAAILSFISFREKITLNQFLGMIIGFLGIIPILSVTVTGEFFFISIPELMLLLAIFAHCYGMVIARKLVRDRDQPALIINGIRMLGGGFLCLLTAFPTEGFFPVTEVVPFVIGMSVLIIISNIVCQGWYLHLLKTYSFTFLSFADFLNPLFTAVYGWFFLCEVITWHYAVSGMLVFFGLYIFYKDELKILCVT